MTLRFASLLAISGALVLFGCGASRDLNDNNLGAGDPDGGGLNFDADDPFDVGEGGPPGPCTGLACEKASCPAGIQTTISGTIYAPNGKLPLYNVIAYIPNAEVAPLPKGATCDKCGATVSGSPIVTALSDAKGQFVLKDVPVGTNIPLVIQLGKWRRIVKIPKVEPCVDNKLTDPNLTRLPKNQSEGNLPKIAVTVGGCDKLACMLPKIGIDASEYGVEGTSKAVHFYKPSSGFLIDGPAGMKDARVLWDNPAKLKEYDIAIFSCECTEATSTKGTASYAAVNEYLNAGGRIFTTDFQYLWYKQSPDANMRGVGSIPGGAPTGGNPVNINTSFPKGKALADWLSYVDKSVAYGKVQCDYVFNNFSPADPGRSQTWGSSSGGSGGAGSGNNPRFLTINTPVGKPVESQCGKAVHLDAHINGSDTINASFPSGCTTPIKQGEEAFAFFFFDLSSCIQKEGDPPAPPPIK